MNFLLIFLFTFCSFSLPVSSLSAETHKYLIKMMGQPMGYSVEKREKVKKEDGSCVENISLFTKINVSRGKSTLTTESRSTISVTCGTLKPLTILSEIREGDSVRKINGFAKDNVFYAALSRGGKTEKHEFPLEEDVTFLGLITEKLSEKELLSGGKATVISEETLRLGKVFYKAKKKGDILEVHQKYKDLPIVELRRNNLMLKMTVSNVISYEYKEDSKLETKGASFDVIDISSIENKGLKISDPRKTEIVKMKISGNTEGVSESCGHKTVKKGKNSKIIVSDMKKRPGCEKNDNLKNFLKPSIYEEIDSPEIQKVAGQWSSIEKDEKKLEAALNFVYRHIKNKTYDHINLSAKEVLLKKAGDCTEHSTLLSALLKVSGVPVKMVYGVVLGKNNKFMFHNWNEVHIDGNWIPVDATFGKIPADAARIAFVRSSGASSENEKVAFAVLRILNSLSIEVISHD